MAGGGYLLYTKALALTSPTPLAVQSFDGGDDLYNRAKQKVADFDHDLKNHQAATIELSADEINTLIARDPNFTKNNIRLFVTMTNDEGRMQASIPTGIMTGGLLKERYLNGDTSFGLNFDSAGKNVDFKLHHLQIGDRKVPGDMLPTAQNVINQEVNQSLQSIPEFKDFLQQVKSIQIKEGELTIETE